MMAKFIELQYKLLENPVYSADLAPSDYLFPNMKKFLAGKCFTLNDGAITTMEDYFVDLPESNLRMI